MTNGGWVEDWSDSFSEFEPRFDLSAHRHAKQLAIAMDPSWIRCVIGTRRSGKTEENCLEALEVVLIDLPQADLGFGALEFLIEPQAVVAEKAES